MIPDMNDIIGENITEVLREKEKTVEELAEALNLSVIEVRQVLWGIQVINGPMMSERRKNRDNQKGKGSA